MNSRVVAISVIAGVAIVVSLLFIIQTTLPLKVEVSGPTGPSISPTPTPSPSLHPCESNFNPPDPTNSRCRRLAAKQPIYPGIIPAFATFVAPRFTDLDFQQADAYSIHSTAVRIPHCPAWNPVRSIATGYPDNSLGPYPSPAHEHFYFIAYAAPLNYPPLRSLTVGGFLQSDLLARVAYNVTILGVDNAVWVSPYPLSCLYAAGKIVDAKP